MYSFAITIPASEYYPFNIAQNLNVAPPAGKTRMRRRRAYRGRVAAGIFRPELVTYSCARHWTECDPAVMGAPFSQNRTNVTFDASTGGLADHEAGRPGAVGQQRRSGSCA